MIENEQRNVLGEPIKSCSEDPLTGFFRDGCCNTGTADLGSHTVCVELTAAFLEFSRERGNDLASANPAFGFPGLKPGDRWCLCAARWQEAMEAGRAPRVALQSTNLAALEVCKLEDLKRYAVDIN